MCFGVRDAIALAHREQNHHGALTILGDLVHNETVLGELRGRGIRMENELDRVRTDRVMITAHGAAEQTKERARARGFALLEATCPLVTVAHQAVAELVQAGFHPVIIGCREHVEVRGLTGDLAEFDVVLTEADVRQLRARPRFGVAAQTTQPLDRVQRLLAVLREHFPQSEVRFVDTVCRPTKQRQQAAVELARDCDVVVVIGGARSNNTAELAATCRRHGARVHQVESAGELRAGWFTDTDTVGLTAGTSTPDATIQAVAEWLHQLAAWQATRNGLSVEPLSLQHHE